MPDARLVERWCHSTPDDFVFDVKLHQLLSRHSANLKLLPPALQKNAEADAKGRVKLTPKIERAMIDEFRRPLEILRAAGKLGALLLQLSPGFSPKKHQLGELDDLLGALADYRIAIELRNRNWVEGENLEPTLNFFRKHSATLVSVDAPAERHFTIMPPDLNAITNPELAYLRLHGRDAHAYTTGKTVAARFNYDYSDEEIEEVAERARDLGERGEGSARRFQQQRARLCAARRAPDAKGAGPNDSAHAGTNGAILAYGRPAPRRSEAEPDNERRRAAG